VKWFFDKGQSGDERFEKLLAALQSWRGTRFIPCVAVKGAGVDCVRFAERVLVECDAIDPIRWPAYVTSGGGPAMLIVLLDHLSRISRLLQIWQRGSDAPRPEFMRGDLLLISTGVKLHHLSIFTANPTLWHCLASSGVCEGNVHDPVVQKHLMAVYRTREK
jgi:hypothetical protein